MTFIELTNELTGTLPGLSPILAQRYINRALTQIYAQRTWAFLETDGLVVCPAVVQTGACSFTQYGTTVTLDATASAANLAQATPGAVPGIQQLQIRFGQIPPGASGIYSITAADITNPAAIILTVDRAIGEVTNATSAYQIYRCLVTPPITDFLRWDSAVDQSNAITLGRSRLTRTSAQFDMMDPQRTSQGLAYWWGAWGGNRISDITTGATVPNATVNAGTPIYELWPHPTNGQTWYVRFRRSGPQLINPLDEVAAPEIITDALILERAKFEHAYPFCMANVANFPQMKHNQWVSLIAIAKAEYKSLWLQSVKLDDEQQLTSVFNMGHGLRTGRPFGRFGEPGYPHDANFLQSHLIRF